MEARTNPPGVLAFYLFSASLLRIFSVVPIGAYHLYCTIPIWFVPPWYLPVISTMSSLVLTMIEKVSVTLYYQNLLYMLPYCFWCALNVVLLSKSANPCKHASTLPFWLLYHSQFLKKWKLLPCSAYFKRLPRIEHSPVQCSTLFKKKVDQPLIWRMASVFITWKLTGFWGWVWAGKMSVTVLLMIMSFSMTSGSPPFSYNSWRALAWDSRRGNIHGLYGVFLYCRSTFWSLWDVVPESPKRHMALTKATRILKILSHIHRLYVITNVRLSSCIGNLVQQEGSFVRTSSSDLSTSTMFGMHFIINPASNMSEVAVTNSKLMDLLAKIPRYAHHSSGIGCLEKEIVDAHRDFKVSISVQETASIGQHGT